MYENIFLIYNTLCDIYWCRIAAGSRGWLPAQTSEEASLAMTLYGKMGYQTFN